MVSRRALFEVVARNIPLCPTNFRFWRFRLDWARRTLPCTIRYSAYTYTLSPDVPNLGRADHCICPGIAFGGDHEYDRRNKASEHALKRLR